MQMLVVRSLKMTSGKGIGANVTLLLQSYIEQSRPIAL
jgi:hypothetical protein